MSTISNENYSNVHIVSIADPGLEKTNFTITTETTGTSSVNQITSIKVGAFATIADFSYFNLFSALNERHFFFYFNKNNIVKRPIVADMDGNDVKITTGDTAIEIAVILANKINSDSQLSRYFTAEVDAINTDTVNITNKAKGLSLSAYDGAVFDLSTIGLATLKAIVGYILVSERRGYVNLQTQQFIKFVVNTAGSNTFFNY